MKERDLCVLVTGARGALGSVVVEKFLRDGAKVVGIDLGEGDGGIVADEERENLMFRAADLTRPDAVRAVFEESEARLGRIDVVVHCAGGFRWTKMDEASDADLDFLVDVNLKSSLYVVREALKAMKPQGFGRIVLISSRSTLKPGVGEGAYTATKAGLNALTQAVAEEIKEVDITINALQPVIIDTPANRQEMPDAPHHRWVKREELAEIIATLVGPTGSAINGAQIAVSGRL